MENDPSVGSFIPAMYDILKCLEKEPHDLTVKINELKSQLQKTREMVEQLQGVDLSKDLQLRQMEILRQQLNAKTDLLRKYKNSCYFDVPK
ncbi:hypothetical protein HELRODRAFT_72187 [Helobdella robusta]|uniref:Mediator of RNA polymerase II transcription subunit 9 n=1 Tax=Helobdella robusta TaxID=6412 RepID=T1G0X0_HELRO|nr:hypothetical protein HELRODRAFT_72187 [Helobdella robusta]ESO10559.1 hypothetical protein HELRODRAFT_72187 [Helobdella robusta]